MKQSLKLIGYNLIALMVMLIIAEIILRFIPVEDPYLRFKQYVKPGYIKSQFIPHTSLSLEIEDSLPGFEHYLKSTHFSTNSFGFRGTEFNPKDESTYRIFCIGGSTTECFRLNDGDDWPSLLEKSTPKIHGKKVIVENCGKSGDELKDHISMLAHRIVYLKPNMVILYAGINDLRKSFFDNNPYNIEANSISTISTSKMWLSEFQIFRRTYYLLKKMEAPSTESISLKSNYRSEVERSKLAPSSNASAPVDTNLFRTKIRTIAGICSANNIKLIIVTQKTNWGTEDKILNRWIYMNQIGDSIYSRQTLQTQMDLLNDIQIEESQSQHVSYINLDDLIPSTSEYFYDDCHFNPNGCKEMAKILSNHIQQHEE